MSDQKPYVGRNALFYTVDPIIEAARRVPGWSEFHKACGRQGLYFEDIERTGRSRKEYGAVATRVEPRRDMYLRYKVADGRGDGPIAAVLSAFDAAVAAGFPVDPAHRLLLDGTPPSTVIDDYEEMFG